MFGLPDGVAACLSDMDGVVTRTAVVQLRKHGADVVVTGLAELLDSGGPR